MSGVSWSTSRRWAPAACLLSTACVDPKQDFDDWLTRTADARSAASTVEAGVSDTGVPDAGFEGTYLMSCLSSLSVGNPADALLFKTTVAFHPSGDRSADTGAGGFDFTQIPLIVHAQDLSQTAPGGMLVTVDGTPVSAQGTCDVHIGASTIPSQADPIGADIVFSDSSLHFQVSPDDLCATLSGHVTAPLMADLNPAQSFCIFRPGTSPLPTFQAADLHCP
jgi:hypothetical protein